MAFKGPAARGGSEKDIRHHKGRRSVRRRFALLFAVALAPFSIGVAGGVRRSERRAGGRPARTMDKPGAGPRARTTAADARRAYHPKGRGERARIGDARPLSNGSHEDPGYPSV